MDKEEKPLFGFCTDDHREQLYIKANPNGLRKFASFLQDKADRMDREPIPKIEITKEDNSWMDGEFFVHSIEKAEDSKSFWNEKESPAETWKGQIIGFGCLIVAILVGCALVVGFQTMFGWFYK